MKSKEKIVLLVLLMLFLLLFGCKSKAENSMVLIEMGKSNSYYIGKYEVKQKDFEEIMGLNPSYFKDGNLPVESNVV